MAFAAPLIPFIPTILSAGASVLGGVSALQSGNYQAAVARNNAIIAERNAALASEASQTEAMRSDRDYAALLGEQLAAQGASGLDILGRTQVATRMAQQRVGMEQAKDIRMKGTNEARAFLQDAADSRSAGSQAKTQSILSAIGSFMEAGSSVAGALGAPSSLVSKGRRQPRPWDRSPNWYGRS